MAQRVKLLPGMWETWGSIPESGRYAGEGNGKPTPVLLPGEPHGGRSLIGYSPWGRKEWDTTERFHFSFCLPFLGLHCLSKLLITLSQYLSLKLGVFRLHQPLFPHLDKIPLTCPSETEFLTLIPFSL